jgi:hypothetical protein
MNHALPGHLQLARAVDRTTRCRRPDHESHSPPYVTESDLVSPVCHARAAVRVGPLVLDQAAHLRWLHVAGLGNVCAIPRLTSDKRLSRATAAIGVHAASAVSPFGSGRSSSLLTRHIDIVPLLDQAQSGTYCTSSKFLITEGGADEGRWPGLQPHKAGG